jgi:hypothetical protein
MDWPGGYRLHVSNYAFRRPTARLYKILQRGFRRSRHAVSVWYSHSCSDAHTAQSIVIRYLRCWQLNLEGDQPIIDPQLSKSRRSRTLESTLPPNLIFASSLPSLHPPLLLFIRARLPAILQLEALRLSRQHVQQNIIYLALGAGHQPIDVMPQRTDKSALKRSRVRVCL